MLVVFSDSRFMSKCRSFIPRLDNKKLLVFLAYLRGV
ncbi:hypothetical protein PRUB_b6007 [Pseudoalteromonas rubra]|uniref:Uncharacterized protein n=1 Tax=Pseudoalteromonas rubra TaxID=43658 RepID=A0A8T0BZ78_9GAMM|nr:hypothetical protein PRUB_b6007 [Pseudoalteromonas rubra]